jgi:hypothetical protein
MLLRQSWLPPCRGMLITYAAGRPKPQSLLQTGVSGLVACPVSAISFSYQPGEKQTGGVRRKRMKDVTQPFQRMTALPDAALGDNVRRFWDIQNELLDGMEKFASGWFERRHVGTRAALEAAQRMCKAQTPVDLVREYQTWIGGAYQRVMADGYACQQFVGAFAGLLQDARSQQPETRTPHRKAA